MLRLTLTLLAIVVLGLGPGPGSIRNALAETADAPHADASVDPIADPNSSEYGYCILCHGTEGAGSQPVAAPRIGGMESWYLERQLTAFRAGWRGAHPDDDPGGEMRAMALVLDGDAAVREVSEHFAAYPAARPMVTVQGDTERGRALYAACAGCHGAGGEGNAALMAPALSRQSDWYLVTQLKHYREGLRGTDPADTLGQQMRAMAAALQDDEAVRDVVAYINTFD